MANIKEIKRIPVVSFALIVAIVSAITLLIADIVMTILGASMYSMMPSINVMPIMSNYNSMFTVGMSTLYSIMVMPIIAFICIFLITALAAIIYNLIAPIIGGIKLEIE